MATTIQLSRDTKCLLTQLKGHSRVTYDEIIRELTTHKEKIPRSLFGKHPDLPPWNKTR